MVTLERGAVPGRWIVGLEADADRKVSDRAEGRVFQTVLADAEIRDFTRCYRTSARVRTLQGLRVRAVAPEGEQPPGTVIAPTLEEAYLAEIERADAESGRSRSADRFAFLDEARVR